MAEKFEHWGIVELMGHQRAAGRVTEEMIGGANMLRVDVPNVSDKRLLEIASNMQACVPFEFGPLDLQDIRTAVLELYRLRTRPRGTPLLDAALKRLAENDEEIMRLRSVALAARALVQSVQPSLDADLEAVSEPALTTLESALEAAGYGMTEEEAVDG